MPLFTPADADAIVAQFAHAYSVLGRALGHPTHDVPSQESPPLYRDIMRMIGVANGMYDRTESNVRRAELALERTVKLLQWDALSSAESRRAAVPDSFWNTNLGVLVSRTRWWVSADDLLTVSNAAALAFGENSQANRMRITRAIARGELQAVPDPSVANPQHNKRVLRQEIEVLRLQRVSPTPSKSKS